MRNCIHYCSQKFIRIFQELFEDFRGTFEPLTTMSEVPHYVLYEHAVGYALLKVKEFEDAALIVPEVCWDLINLFYLHAGIPAQCLKSLTIRTHAIK